MLGNLLDMVSDEVTKIQGKEATEEQVQFSNKVIAVCRKHQMIRFMVLMAMLSTEQHGVDEELFMSLMASGARLYRSALEEVAPEMLAQVDAKLFEEEGEADD